MIDLKKESATLNEKKLSVEIDVLRRSWIDRILRRPAVRTFIVKQPPIGVLEEIGALVCDVAKYDEMDNQNFMPMVFERLKSDTATMVNVMACLLECKAYPSNQIKFFIRNNVLPGDVVSLISRLFEFADIPSFLNTIILMKGMSLKKTEEIIASENEDKKTSGEQSEM